MIGKTNGQIAGSNALSVPSIPFSVNTLTYGDSNKNLYFHFAGASVPLAIQDNYVVLKDHMLYANNSDVYYSNSTVKISDVQSLLSQIDITKLPDGNYYLNLVFVADSNISEDGTPSVNIPVPATYCTTIRKNGSNISIVSATNGVISGQNVTGSGRLYLMDLNRRHY